MKVEASLAKHNYDRASIDEESNVSSSKSMIHGKKSGRVTLSLGMAYIGVLQSKSRLPIPLDRKLKKG